MFISPKPFYDFRNYYDYRHGVGIFRLLPHPEKVTHIRRVTLLNALEHIFPKKLPTSTSYVPEIVTHVPCSNPIFAGADDRQKWPKTIISAFCDNPSVFVASPFYPHARPRQPGGRKPGPTARNDPRQDGHPDYRPTISAAPN